MAKKKQNKKVAIISLIAFIICLILAVAISLSMRSTSAKPSLEFNGEIANGIDVSSHNGNINWNDVAGEVDFAFIRAGYRGYADASLNLDKSLNQNLKDANESSVPVGVYFFSQATSVEEAEEEAEFVIKAVRHYKIDLPIAIDIEYAYNKDGKFSGRLYNAKLSKKETAKIINAFCKRVEKAGYTSAVYASSSFFKSVIDTKSLNDSICIWVADYNENITYGGDYDIWQYTKRGKCNGVNSKYVDKNYWYIKK